MRGAIPHETISTFSSPTLSLFLDDESSSLKNLVISAVLLHVGLKTISASPLPPSHSPSLHILFPGHKYAKDFLSVHSPPAFLSRLSLPPPPPSPLSTVCLLAAAAENMPAKLRRFEHHHTHKNSIRSSAAGVTLGRR